MRRHVESTARSLGFPAIILAVAALLACSKSPNRTGSASRSASEGITIEAVTATETVKAIDHATRTITLESPNGEIKTYRVGPEMVRFDEIHVGDKINATVAEPVAVGIRKAGAPSNLGLVGSATLLTKDAKPGIVVTKTTEATAKIIAIDIANRTITFAEPTGESRTMKLAPGVDVSNLKKDDGIVVSYTDGLALWVSKP